MGKPRGEFRNQNALNKEFKMWHGELGTANKEVSSYEDPSKVELALIITFIEFYLRYFGSAAYG